MSFSVFLKYCSIIKFVFVIKFFKIKLNKKVAVQEISFAHMDVRPSRSKMCNNARIVNGNSRNSSSSSSAIKRKYVLLLLNLYIKKALT